MKTESNSIPYNMEKPNYNLTFYDALKEVLENNAWIKGDNFIDGIYLKKDNNGNLVTVDVGRLSMHEPAIIGSLHRQKYRIITVATMRELMR